MTSAAVRTGGAAAPRRSCELASFGVLVVTPRLAFASMPFLKIGFVCTTGSGWQSRNDRVHRGLRPQPESPRAKSCPMRLSLRAGLGERHNPFCHRDLLHPAQGELASFVQRAAADWVCFARPAVPLHPLALFVQSAGCLCRRLALFVQPAPAPAVTPAPAGGQEGHDLVLPSGAIGFVCPTSDPGANLALFVQRPPPVASWGIPAEGGWETVWLLSAVMISVAAQGHVGPSTVFVRS